MTRATSLKVRRVENAADRASALAVLREVYAREKGWESGDDRLLPACDLGSAGVSWFLAELGGRAVGVTRSLYDLPLHLYRQYGLKLLDPSFDVDGFLARARLAEVGRFAVLEAERGNVFVAAGLMRASGTEALERGCTHLITDVFENEATSPYAFHTRVLGFKLIAVHDKGELKFEGRRLTLLLDIAEACDRLRARGGWIFRFLSRDWSPELLESARSRRAAAEPAPTSVDSALAERA